MPDCSLPAEILIPFATGFRRRPWWSYTCSPLSHTRIPSSEPSHSSASCETGAVNSAYAYTAQWKGSSNSLSRSMRSSWKYTAPDQPLRPGTTSEARTSASEASAVPIGHGLGHLFNTPRSLTEEEIRDIITRFATSAALAREAGFDGVQIHAAHGYLVNQFLSPHHNRREDDWGGDAERRRRFLLEVYRAMRRAVGDDHPIGIKLNSADFLRGGFTEEESMEVVESLAGEGIDLVEVSGGTYEKPAMVGHHLKESTRRREAYFLDYAEKVRRRVSTPIVVTGGFRTGPAMLEALNSGATDFIGLGRPLAVDPDLPNRLLADPSHGIDLPRPTTGLKAVDRMVILDLSWWELQLRRMGRGLEPKADLSAWRSVWTTLTEMGVAAFRRRRA